MIRHLLAVTLLASSVAYAQEGVATQTIIGLNQRLATSATANDFTVKVDNRATQLSALTPVRPGSAQIALLIDDGLRTSVGRELGNLKAFITGLPQGTEVFIGYMQNGRVVPASTDGFTVNLAAAAQGLRMPTGVPGMSASPYFCLSDFVKNWPSNAESGPVQSSVQQPTHKARFILMISNGVDPYNGSTSIMNQGSPYVDAAITDAQRAGVPVYSVYFTDAGFGGRGRSSFSGQSYLSQMAQSTGGISFYQGSGNPVSLTPYLKQFIEAVSESYVATFPVDANKKLVRLKASSSLPKIKPRVPDSVRPGTVVLQ